MTFKIQMECEKRRCRCRRLRRLTSFLLAGFISDVEGKATEARVLDCQLSVKFSTLLFHCC